MMVKNFRFKMFLFITFIFSIVLISFSSLCNARTQKTIEEGTLTIGTNATFKPFEYKDGDGNIVGFDIDLINEIGKKMGMKIKFVDMPFESLLSSLGSRLDLVIAGLTATDERKKFVNFSNSYFEGKQFILTKKNVKIKNENSFKNLTIASQIGTTAADIAKKLADKNKNNTNVKEYDEYEIMVEDLLQDKVNAVILDEITAKTYAKKYNNKLKATNGSVINCPIENSCIACSKDNTDLLNEVNRALEEIKKSPTYADLVKKHMDIDIKTNTKNLNTLKKGTLTVALNATFAPFEFKAEDGEIKGIDIEIIKEICAILGLKLEIQDMPFEAIIPSIGAKADIAISGLTATDERKKYINFSKPYFEVKQYILTKKNMDIKDENSFKNLTIASQIGTTAADIAKKLADKNKNNTNVKEYDEYEIMVEDLLQDKVNAVILDEITAKTYAKKYNDKLKATNGSIINCPIENYCIACSKENEALLEEINKALLKFKTSGAYDKIIKEYVNIDLNEMGQNKEDQKNGLKEQFYTSFLEKGRWKLYLKGLGITMTVTIFAAILGFFIGIILAIMKISKNKKGKQTILSKFASIYISIIRGTPVLVQLLIMWLIIFKNAKNGVIVAIISFGLNSAAYVAEIIRGGINAVDKGQTEAANSMGFSTIKTMYYIVLPQGLKNSIPPLCNEFISLVKETAIVGYVALPDLTRAAFSISAASYQTFMPLIIAALIYFVVTKTFSIILEFIERRLAI